MPSTDALAISAMDACAGVDTNVQHDACGTTFTSGDHDGRLVSFRRTISFPSYSRMHSEQATLVSAQCVREICFLCQYRSPFLPSASEFHLTCAERVAIDSNILSGSLPDEQMEYSYTYAGPSLATHVVESYGSDPEPKRSNQANLPFPQFVFSVIYQMCFALDELHKRKIMHGKLTPESTCYLAFRVRISQWSAAIYRKEVRTSSAEYAYDDNSTPHYDAPEVLAGGILDYKCNVWSVGMIAVYLLARCHHSFFSGKACASKSPCEYKDEIHAFYTRERLGGKKNLSLDAFKYILDRYPCMHSIFNMIESMLRFDPTERADLSSILDQQRNTYANYDFDRTVLPHALPFMVSGSSIGVAMDVPVNYSQPEAIQMVEYMRKFRITSSERTCAIYRIAKLAKNTGGEMCFVLGIHIWERYCTSRQQMFRDEGEYTTAGYVSQYIAWCLLFKRAYKVTMILDSCIVDHRFILETEHKTRLYTVIKMLVRDILLMSCGKLYEETFDQCMQNNCGLDVQIRLLLDHNYYELDVDTLRTTYRQKMQERTSVENIVWWMKPPSSNFASDRIKRHALPAACEFITPEMPGMFKDQVHELSLKMIKDDPHMMSKYLASVSSALATPKCVR